MTKQRFIVKFVNKVWAVFDTVNYRNVTVRQHEAQAQREAKRRNEMGA